MGNRTCSVCESNLAPEAPITLCLRCIGIAYQYGKTLVEQSLKCPECGEAEPAPGAPIRRCMLCILKLSAAINIYLDEDYERDPNPLIEDPPPFHEAPWDAIHQPIIYFIQRGERIKIGTTTSFARRMRELKPDAVLAIEPGGYDTEAERHKSFRADRVSREWFTDSPAIRQHVARLLETEPQGEAQRARLFT